MNKQWIAVAVLCAASGARAQMPGALNELKALQEKAGPLPPIEIPKEEPVPAFSDSYEQLAANNDGSTTIVEPRFNNPTGAGRLPISFDYSSVDI